MCFSTRNVLPGVRLNGFSFFQGIEGQRCLSGCGIQTFQEAKKKKVKPDSLAFVERSNSKVGVFIGSLSKCGADLLFSPFFLMAKIADVHVGFSFSHLAVFLAASPRKKTMRGCKTNERRSEVSPGRRVRPRLLAREAH